MYALHVRPKLPSAVEVLSYVEGAKKAGATTLQHLADLLTARGVRTPRGMKRWRPEQVQHFLDPGRNDPRISDPPSPERSHLKHAHLWIQPGATFSEGGETKRITRIADGVVHGVQSSGGFWSWPLTSVLAAADTGRIQQAPHDRPQRPPAPKRRRLYLSKVARERLAEIRAHPLVVDSSGELPRLVLGTLQALRNGTRAEPPKLLTLLLVAQAGAEAQNLGRLVACPERKGGRRSGNEDQARDVQLLLARLSAHFEGHGGFTFGDLQRVGSLAERGLQAILRPDTADEDKRGRPQQRLPSVQGVRARLACRWRQHERGTYKLSDAIQEVAEQEVLHAKRAAASWRNKDPELVTLDRHDDDDLRLRRDRIERAYHRAFPHPLTQEERRMYRHLAAVQLQLARRLRR